MKIAVTYADGQVFQHFGHTEALKLYEIEDNRVVNSEIISTEGSGHAAIADVLKMRARRCLFAAELADVPFLRLITTELSFMRVFRALRMKLLKYF